VVSEIAAEQRAYRARQAEHTAEQTCELAALARWEQIRDDAKSRGEQRSATQTLDGAKYDELHHAAAEQRQITELSRQAG
jgi:hypothetical protein